MPRYAPVAKVQPLNTDLSHQTPVQDNGLVTYIIAKTVGPTRSSRSAAVEIPDPDSAGVIPIDPLGDVLRRKRGAGLVTELARAIFAVADAIPIQAVPAVVGQSPRVASLDDFREDSVAVRTVHARDVFVVGAVRVPGTVAREPIRMGLKEIFGGPVRVHAPYHHESIRMSRLGKSAIQITLAKKLRAVL
jgi:hypothetical protein